MAADDNTVFGFSESVADELIANLGQKVRVSSYEDSSDATRLVLAYTTGGATARSGTTCGTGTATLRYLAASGATRTITTTSDSVTFYNVSEMAVGTNRYVMLLRLGGDFLANWEDCV
jgi:hypothetical protein